VMMLDMDKAPLRQGYVRYLPVGLLVAGVMLVQMLALIGVRNATAVALPEVTAEPNTLWLARALFTDFVLPFEVAAVILTVAVVAAVMLTLRRRPEVRHQNPAEQVSARAADRVRMVKMKAEVPVASTQTEEGAQ
jgi:NADH-quinone oxidoreductase subunit J